MAYFKCGLPSDKTEYGTMPNISANAQGKATLGFKPKVILVGFMYSNSAVWCLYDESVSTTQFRRVYGTNNTMMNIGSGMGIASIDDDGFKIMSSTATITNINYIAL